MQIKPVALLVALVVVSGCMSTGSVEVIEPPAVQLSAYRDLVLVHSSDDPVHAPQAEALARQAQASLTQAAAFGSVSLDGTRSMHALELQLVVAEYEPGNKLRRLFNLGGEAQLAVRCSLFDARGKPVGQFVATGNSLYTGGSWEVNGFSSRWLRAADDLEKRALVATANEITRYLSTR